MIKRIEDLNFYEVLEVKPSATTQEIHKAYERVRKIYDPNSIALYSLFSPEETAAMQQRIEEAYRTLIYEDNRRQYDAILRERNELPEPEAPSPSRASSPPPVQPAASTRTDNISLFDSVSGPQQAPDEASLSPAHEEVKPVPQFNGEFTGPAIKALREQSGRNLRSIADITRVSIRYLEFIEEENFLKLPARTYIRGFLVLYARALDCNAERFAGDYMKRYDAAMKPAKTK
jgi:curved DNA-binding protein CbpA